MVQNNVVIEQDGNNSVGTPGGARMKANQKKRNQNSGDERNADVKCPRKFRLVDYTPLNNSMKNIDLATQGVERYNKPHRNKAFERHKQSGKYCRFHEIHMHITNECRHLMDATEELMRNKKLQQYVEKPQNGERATRPHNPTT